jgi:sugar transferase (PEP-CTERM system associated)
MVVRIFRHFVPVSVILLAVCELAAMSVTWYFCLLGSSHTAINIQDIGYLPSLRLALLAAIAMSLTGLYHNSVFSDYRALASQVAITLISLCPITLIGVYYWKNPEGLEIPLWEIYWKAAFSWLVCIAVTRAVFLTLADLDLFKTRILVLGTGDRAANVAALVAAGRNRHFLPLAYLCSSGKRSAVTGHARDICATDPDAIARIAEECRATEVIVATDERRGLPVHQLLQCRLAGVRVTDYLDFIERETKTVELDALQPGWLVFSDGFRGCGPAKIGKRCFDVFISLGLLIFTLPLMVLTGLLIMLDSPGPLLYRQERVGLGGRPFMLLKFRSMKVDAEANGVPRWAATRDVRVTRVGSIIRKLRIDELPQLINVLRGDMSFVGPRPERPQFVDEFIKQIPFYAERHCVKPGITGWAQVNYPYGASLEDARNKLAYDLYYVKNNGLFLDLIIVMQTIRVILWADGSR